MTIFGYGKIGSSVATNLSELSNKKLFCLTKSDFPPLKNVEEAESVEVNFSLDIQPKSSVYFICSGEEKIAGGILRTLEKIKKAKIKLIYIIRDEDLLSEEVKKQQRAIGKILQNYARSALFEDICLIDEKTFKESFMPEVSLFEYDKVFSQTLAKMINMVNWLKNEDSFHSDIEEPNEACRVNSLGVFADAEEKIVFSLDNVRQKDVYFACSKQTLKTDTELLEKIKETLKKMKKEGVKVEYKIVATDYEQDFVYLLYHTNFIQ
tara:strand:+ start:472 stop:1266 length:795 start_codon:yes stop_codon:yes gene_type:complete